MDGHHSHGYHQYGMKDDSSSKYDLAGTTDTNTGLQSSYAECHVCLASARTQRDDEDKDMKKLNQAYVNMSIENADLKRQLESMTQALSRSRDQCNNWEDRTKTLEMELSECNTRKARPSWLGSKIMDNNPHIADLSDPNRATKLAERYSELYDNQWHDAFEAYEEHFNTEKESVEALVKLLQQIKRHCDNMAKDQVNKLQETLVGRKRHKLADNVFKQLKNLRILTAEKSFQEVLQKYMTNNLPTANALESDERVKPFVRECVKLCWLMSVQDPPLAFGPIPKYSDGFDTNAYKFYNKSGPTIAFVVWPALYLLEGVMLSKGVAQGAGASRCKTAKGRSRDSTGIKYFARPQTASSKQARDRTGVQHQPTSFQQSAVRDRNSTMGTSRVYDSVQMPRDIPEECVFLQYNTYIHNYGQGHSQERHNVQAEHSERRIRDCAREIWGLGPLPPFMEH